MVNWYCEWLQTHMLGHMCSDCAKKKSNTLVYFIGVPFDDSNTVLSGSVNPRRRSWLAALLLTKETHCNLSFSVFTFPLWPEMCCAQWETQALQKRRMLILCLWKWFAPRGPIQTTRRSTFSAAMTPAVSLGLELSTLIRSAATEGKNVWKRGKNLAPPFGVTLLRQQFLFIKKDEKKGCYEVTNTSGINWI